MPVSGQVPQLEAFSDEERKSVEEAFEYMGVKAGDSVQGLEVDVCFIGSCTNGRLSDLREVAKLVRGHQVSQKVKALVVPGSQVVKDEAEAEGLDQIFKNGRV